MLINWRCLKHSRSGTDQAHLLLSLKVRDFQLIVVCQFCLPHVKLQLCIFFIFLFFSPSHAGAISASPLPSRAVDDMIRQRILELQVPCTTLCNTITPSPTKSRNDNYVFLSFVKVIDALDLDAILQKRRRSLSVPTKGAPAERNESEAANENLTMGDR